MPRAQKVSCTTKICPDNFKVLSRRIYLIDPRPKHPTSSIQLIEELAGQNLLDITEAVPSLDEILQETGDNNDAPHVDIELEVDASAYFSPGYPGSYDSPPENATLDDLQVSILAPDKEIPCEAYLTEDDLDRIAMRLGDQVSDEGGDAEDWDD